MRLLRHVAPSAAFSCTLYCLAVWLAPAGSVLLALAPFPALLLAAEGALSAVVLWWIVSSAVLGCVLGPAATLGFSMAIGVPAAGMAWGVHRRWSFERTAAVAMLVWGAVMLMVALAAFGDASSAMAAAREHLARSLDLALQRSGTLAGDGGVPAMDRDAFVDGLSQVLPAIVGLTAGALVLLNLALLRRLRGFGGVQDLQHWRMPDRLVWLLIGSGFAMFVPADGLSITARNVFVLLLGGYFCQGLAIVSYYLGRLGVPRAVRGVVYVFIVMQQLAAAVVLALGVFDLWLNFRRHGAGPARVGFHPDGE
jgi:uncharacterized protein YybS (DUF2232 family)